MKLKKKEDQSVLQFFWEKKQNTHRSNYGDKVWDRDWRKAPSETVLLPGDLSYKQLPIPDIIVDAKKCLQKGAWYGCLLRGPARALHIQRPMLAANHWAELGVPNGGVGGRTGGAEGVCSLMGRMMTLANQTPKGSQGLSHQSRGTHGSRCNCGGGMLCSASVGGEVLGHRKAW